MSALRAAAEEYLSMRRALGFKLTTQGRHLMSFIRFCEERCADLVRADLAIDWATQTTRGSGDEVYQARRLDVVRIFARHMQALDPANEVPPEDVLSRRYRRIPPYLYSPEEVAALMSAADRLAPALRAATWRTLIGLLAVTGMRQGEACRLERGDIDLQARTLVIADSKFGKSRQVFLHPTTAGALHTYEQARDQMFPEPTATTFFLNSRGAPPKQLFVEQLPIQPLQGQLAPSPATQDFEYCVSALHYAYFHRSSPSASPVPLRPVNGSPALPGRA
jgi:integrase